MGFNMLSVCKEPLKGHSDEHYIYRTYLCKDYTKMRNHKNNFKK